MYSDNQGSRRGHQSPQGESVRVHFPPEVRCGLILLSASLSHMMRTQCLKLPELERGGRTGRPELERSGPELGRVGFLRPPQGECLSWLLWICDLLLPPVNSSPRSGEGDPQGLGPTHPEIH